MLNQALFVSAQLYEHEVTLSDGSKEVLHFRKLPAVEWNQYQFALGADDEAAKSRASLRIVMLSLCEPDGKQALSWDQTQQLDPSVAQQMWGIVHKVCKPPAEPGKA